MTFPDLIRRIQSRLDDVLAAYRARDWVEVWRLFRVLRSDVESAADAGLREERSR